MHKATVVSILLCLIMMSTVAQAADIELSETCSLADAITAANTDEAVGECPAGDGADTIVFVADIPLRAELPEIASSIIIDGEGYRISGNAEHRIFYVGVSGKLRIINLNLLDGRADDCRWLDGDGNLKVAEDDSCGGAILNLGVIHISNSSFSDNSVDSEGGAIYNSGTGMLTITSSSFIGNSADYSGGAIDNQGKLRITSSDFSHNSADSLGGAIYNSGVGELSIAGSRFSDNSSGLGGAIYNRDGGELLSITGSSFSSNSATYGGAIYNSGAGELHIAGSSFSSNSARLGGGAISNQKDSDVSIVNSTFSRNRADEGGGIRIASGEATLTHLTLGWNIAERGGGLFVDDDSNARVRLRNSIVAGDSRIFGCWGTIGAHEANLGTDRSCAASLSADAMLDDLVEPEDGSTAYFPLGNDSLAIDAADSLFCPDTDQIGTVRPQGAACDIGAYELPQE